jgi:muramoyltetrapeptide carboxypeptidase
VPAIARPLPQPLAPGARIGVAALAGVADPAALGAGVDWLRQRGYEVVLAPNVSARDGYLAGSDEARLHGLSFLLDDGVNALMLARGGYGITRLLPVLPWQRLAAWGGWVVGFSDATALHAALAHRFPNATLHGPMVTSLARRPRDADALVAWLSGKAPRRLFRFRAERVVLPGKAHGIAVGGNLSLLASLTGTGFEPEYDGAVVFLEDVAEPGYRLDRLLTQMRLSGRLARVRAVVAGLMHRCGRGEVGWHERWRRLLAEAVPDAVVVEGVSFGHGLRNAPFPLGVEVEIDTGAGEICWRAG